MWFILCIFHLLFTLSVHTLHPVMLGGVLWVSSNFQSCSRISILVDLCPHHYFSKLLYDTLLNPSVWPICVLLFSVEIWPIFAFTSFSVLNRVWTFPFLCWCIIWPLLDYFLHALYILVHLLVPLVSCRKSGWVFLCLLCLGLCPFTCVFSVSHLFAVSHGYILVILFSVKLWPDISSHFTPMLDSLEYINSVEETITCP